MKTAARWTSSVPGMNVGGSLLSSILKIVVTAATLALVYILVIKPILHTTESISNSTNDTIQKSMESVNHAFDQPNNGFDTSNGSVKIQRKITRQLKTTQPGAQTPVIKCIQRANQNVNKVIVCSKKYNLIQ
jgi:hypothetical protein